MLRTVHAKGTDNNHNGPTKYLTCSTFSFDEHLLIEIRRILLNFCVVSIDSSRLFKTPTSDCLSATTRPTHSSAFSVTGVYTFRSSDRPVGPTGLSNWSVRRSYRVIASSDRSDRRSEESNMFDFVRLPIRLSKRVDTTSDWSDRLASWTTNHAAA